MMTLTRNLDQQLNLIRETQDHQKKLTMMLCQQTMMSSTFFRFMVDLEQCRMWNPDTWSKIYTFSLIATFSSKKVKTELKNH